MFYFQAPSLDKGLPKLNDMSALLNNLSIISDDLRPSRPSSFGLLPDEALAETDLAEFEKTEVNFNMKSIDDTYEFKKPFDLAPSSLPTKYLNPSTPKFTPNSSVVALDAMFGKYIFSRKCLIEPIFPWKLAFLKLHITHSKSAIPALQCKFSMKSIFQSWFSWKRSIFQTFWKHDCFCF